MGMGARFEEPGVADCRIGIAGWKGGRNRFETAKSVREIDRGPQGGRLA